MLEELKEKVCAANKRIKDAGLVILKWGNVSAIDRKSKLIVIKPSGIPYEELTPEKMVVVDMEGTIVEGELNPSSDTPAHIALYQSFDDIGAIVHTNSRYATVWAQAGLDIVTYGTMHADYFYGDIPCTVPMEEYQIEEDYERNLGFHIAETFARRRVEPLEIPSCLVAYHGPFSWGVTIDSAVENAIVLEEIAHMAVFNSNFQFGLTRIQETLLDKHYFRRHGDTAYYGQDFKPVKEVTEGGADRPPEEDIEIEPSKNTVALKNESEIQEVERPVINKPPKKEDHTFDFGTVTAAPDDDDPMSSDSGPLDFTF